jgi:hypothetical protein
MIQGRPDVCYGPRWSQLPAAQRVLVGLAAQAVGARHRQGRIGWTPPKKASPLLWGLAYNSLQ